LAHARSPSTSRSSSGTTTSLRRFTPVAGLIGLAVGLAWWLLPSTAALLDANELTPKQIHRVAVELLLDSNPKIREQANRKLSEQGPRAVPVLKEICLTYSDDRVRRAVLVILQVLDKEATLAVLERMIGDKDPAMRQVAAGAAAALDHPQTVSLLQKALSDPDPSVRIVAAGGLGQKKDASKSVSALEQVLNDPNPSIRRHAARSLESLTGRSYKSRAKMDP
jgi:HEAT repeat protein